METMGVLSTDMMEGWEIKYVDEKGAVHAELHDKDGNVILKDSKWFTNSLKPLGDWTRDTKRVIRVYGPDGDMVQELAEGTLAPYWDAAQAAKEKLPGNITALEALKGCAAALGRIKAPVDLLEEVLIPVKAVKNTLQDVIKALEHEREEQKK